MSKIQVGTTAAIKPVSEGVTFGRVLLDEKDHIFNSLFYVVI